MHIENSHYICASGYPTPTAAELKREQELQRAIKNHELFVEYQPIFRNLNGELLGVEALVRWNHPERGTVMPADFIPTAEASGLIVPIGEFVLEQACAQLRSWRSAQTCHLTVAVNVSAAQLAHGDFVRVLKECVDDYGIDPCRLELEITESMPFHERSVVVKRLHELKHLGLRIVLDDFGCGYMSLSRLTTLPADGLKIDRTFTRALPDNLKTMAVVRSVIELANRLGLFVVVEGVETECQVRWLRTFGDIGIQGFRYARPGTAEQARMSA